MRQFIDHTELARDRRFVRNNATNQLFLNLPDDQDAIIKLVEGLAPMIQERVQGTPLEEVFDRLGPGFMLSANFQPLGAETPDLDLRLRLRLHTQHPRLVSLKARTKIEEHSPLEGCALECLAKDLRHLIVSSCWQRVV